MKKIVYLALLSTLFLHSKGVKTTEPQHSFGIEFNPIKALMFREEEATYSGTFSYFNHNDSTEISVPWLYYSRDNALDEFEKNDDKQTSILVDLHYRKYFSPHTEGAYVGTFARYAHLSGTSRESNGQNHFTVVDKFGLGFEIGYKIKNIFDTPFYYGMSFALGGYLTNNNNTFSSLDDLSSFAIDDYQRIVDIELFKIGYEF